MLEFNTNLIRLLVIALATFRLTYMLWAEAGPWECFARLRVWLGRCTFLDLLLSCPLCLSVWIALILVMLYQAEMLVEALDVFCLWLAVAAVSLLLFGWERGK